MKLWSCVIFNGAFLEKLIWICKWVSWWCHRLTIFHIFVYKIIEIFHFLAETGKSISPYQNKYIRANIIFCIYSECIYSKFYFLIASFLWTNLMEKIVSQWHHQLISLHIHMECLRNVSWKLQNSKCHNFLIFHPIYIYFFFSVWKRLLFQNLDRISPLRENSWWH